MEPLHESSQQREDGFGAVEFRLLNDFQRDFPLVTRPFAELANRLNVDEATVIDLLRSMRARGLVSRVGAVFRPNVLGASALAALEVPPARLEEVAAQVSELPEINHNYQREHCFNLWFVAAASSAEKLAAVFCKIEAICRCGPVLVLPLLEQFHIDLGFGLSPAAPHRARRAAPAAAGVAAIEMSAAERALVAILQQGLPLVERPFSALGSTEADAMALLSRWIRRGVIARFGVVVRHHELGYTANAMVVWDVPDAVVGQRGRAIAASGQASLCYRRARVSPHWPYNLFCMIHGKDRHEVEQRIATLAQACGLGSYPFEVLFSCRRFKQCGARYVSQANNEPFPELANGSD